MSDENSRCSKCDQPKALEQKLISAEGRADWLTDKLAAAEAENKRFAQLLEWKNKHINEHVEEKKRMREALEFYANKAHWGKGLESKWADRLIIEDCSLFNTGGGRAREALK